MNNALEVRHFALQAVLKEGKTRYPLLQSVMNGFTISLRLLFEEVKMLYENQVRHSYSYIIVWTMYKTLLKFYCYK